MESATRFPCSLCSASYTVQRNLQRHCRTKHGAPARQYKKEIAFNCSVCGHPFRYKSGLNSHMRTFHNHHSTTSVTVTSGIAFPQQHSQTINSTIKEQLQCEEQTSLQIEEIVFETRQDFNQWLETNQDLLSQEQSTLPYVPTTKTSSIPSDSFSAGSQATRHVKAASSRTSRITCPIHTCLCSFSRHFFLVHHLESQHKQQIEFEQLTFQSMQAFNEWKFDVEQETFTLYVQSAAPYLSSTGYRHVYYDCHRSYTYKPQHSQRTPQDSNKIGCMCPSRKIVVIKDSGVEVSYWKTHIGHERLVKSIPLHTSIRSLIADKIKLGVADDKIIEGIRNDGYTGVLPARAQLFKRQDLLNIKREYKLTG